MKKILSAILLVAMLLTLTACGGEQKPAQTKTVSLPDVLAKFTFDGEMLALAQFMQELGACVAYNLDGGGSSTMVLNGEVINKPTSSGKRIQEREVSDILYIG